MTGAERIAAERRRQDEKEGYDPWWDKQHVCGELLVASTEYVKCALRQVNGVSEPTPTPTGWGRSDRCGDRSAPAGPRGRADR